MENNYEIGFRKPPKDSQFKPGQSGNNNGRPKGSKNNNLDDLIIKELDTKIQLKDGTKITKREAAVKQVCNSAASGNYKSIQLVMKATARQQKITSAEEFSDKLIREKYITEADIKEFLNHGTTLNLKATPEAISKLYYGTADKKTWASATMLSIVFLSAIRRSVISSMHLALILQAVAAEYSFWQGFDKALSGLKLSEKERAKLIKKAASGRKYERPDDYLYAAAVKAHSFCAFRTIVAFNNRRDFAKTIAGYAEAERLLLNDDIKKHALAKAKYEMKEADFNNLQEELEDYKKAYIDFNKEAPLPDCEILEVEPTDQEILALLCWHENKSK